MDKQSITSDPIFASVSPEACAMYRAEGYVLLPRLISAAFAATLRQEVMDIMAIIGLGMSKLKQTGEYIAGSAIDTLVNSAGLCDVAATLMEGPSTLYLPFTAVKSGGGGGEFHFHQDNQYTRFDAPGINLWFALTPMREENGCLKVVPRSHLQGTLPSAESPDRDGHRTIEFAPEEFLPIAMEPGDCIAFSRLTVHGSGPNTTDQHRVAYAVQFHRDDVNYTTDAGQTWLRALDHPRWKTGPVPEITPPQGTRDGH